MDMLRSVLVVAATVLVVLAFCSGIKAACRKMLEKTKEKNKGKGRRIMSIRASFFYAGMKLSRMMLGSDKGDVGVIRKLARETGCYIWFPDYPLCTDHCIAESYDMAFEKIVRILRE